MYGVVKIMMNIFKFIDKQYFFCRNENNYFVVGKKLIDTIFFFDPEHCKKSYESEIKRNHFPKNLKFDMYK